MKAFVSGSTQGIGYACAAALAREGAKVVLNGRDEGRVHAAAQRLLDDVPGAAVSGLVADVAEPEQVESMLDALGEVDILINNVGIFGVAPFDQISDETWQRYFDVNVMSGVRLSRRLLPGMLERGWGRIVFVGTESGVSVPADMIHYGATKAAMLALANGLAKLTRGTRVTVNSVLGGPTLSDGVMQTIGEIAAAQSMDADELTSGIIAGNRTSLLERFIDPTEIAELVLYLASARSGATTGAAVRADGGVLTTTI